MSSGPLHSIAVILFEIRRQAAVLESAYSVDIGQAETRRRLPCIRWTAARQLL